jgi:hypothetical protein
MKVQGFCWPGYVRRLDNDFKQLELELHTPSGITQGSFVVPFSDLEMLPMN